MELVGLFICLFVC